MIDNHTNGVVEKEVQAILKRCGLLNTMPHFHNSLNSEETPLEKMEETSPASLSKYLKAFFGLIVGSEVLCQSFEQLQVPKLRSEACFKVARLLAEVYELIYQAIIMDPTIWYLDPKSLARHPPDQIRTILGI